MHQCSFSQTVFDKVPCFKGAGGGLEWMQLTTRKVQVFTLYLVSSTISPAGPLCVCICACASSMYTLVTEKIHFNNLPTNNTIYGETDYKVYQAT